MARRWFALLLLAATAGLPAELDFRQHQAVQESLSRVPPRLRNRWLNERGLELPGFNVGMPASDRPDSLGLRLRGKWGRGPSVEVTGRDSLIFLSLGSEVAIVNFSNPDSPQVLGEVQALGLVAQVAVRDSLLYIGCKAGVAGIEVWNVRNPTTPIFRSRTPSMLSDFCISDTFLYLTQDLSGVNDTFKVYSIGNTASPRLLGTCRDSGACITVAGNTAFLGDRWGLYAVDVSNPGQPRTRSAPGVATSSAPRPEAASAV
jgi:hypothetical protein